MQEKADIEMIVNNDQMMEDIIKEEEPKDEIVVPQKKPCESK